MTAKEYLMQLQTIDVKIQEKIEESASLRALVLGRGVSYDGDHVQTSPQNKQEEVIIKYVYLEQKIDCMIDRYLYTKDRIIDEIHELSDARFVKILHDHYVPDAAHHVRSLEQIAVAMGYSYDSVRHLHGYALLAFEEKILASQHKITQSPVLL
jgi:hypothetical protein